MLPNHKMNNMPSLQVREMPPAIYNRLQKNAKKQHRSLAQEAVVTLAKGLDTQVSNIERRTVLLDRIALNPVINTDDLPDPVAFIREDRER